jgi:hypothetical protein
VGRKTKSDIAMRQNSKIHMSNKFNNKLYSSLHYNSLEIALAFNFLNVLYTDIKNYTKKKQEQHFRDF